MPFSSGGWALNGTHPKSHSYFDADWATDLYQASGTKVKALVSESNVTLKILGNPKTLYGKSSSCGSGTINAGKTVRIGVWRAGQKLGWFSFQHLDAVPTTIKDGAKISNGTVLGKLKKWAKSGCYWVTYNNASSVHTHASGFSYDPHYSCYRNLTAGNRYGTDVWIGKVGKTSATGKRQACR